MKKKLVLLIMIINLIFISNVVYSAESDKGSKCEYNGTDIGLSLNACLNDSKLVNGDYVSLDADGGFATQIKLWTNNLALYLGIFAVGSIVVGALMMTISAGEEEKIKKGKDIVMWGMIGFIGLISVSAIINLVVKIMYSI